MRHLLSAGSSRLTGEWPCRESQTQYVRSARPRPGTESAGPKQNPRRARPARVGDSRNDLPLAGGESPHGDSKRVSALSAGPTTGQTPSRGDRTQPPPGGPFASLRDKRVAAPDPCPTRVRFEFAGRAHQREVTPNVGINLAARSCQEESDLRGKKSEKIFGRALSGAAAPISRVRTACVTAEDSGGGSRQDKEPDSF